MSNFFGALDSDDEGPAPRAVKPAAGKPAAGQGHDASRVTGATKKNRDQQRHGAAPRNGAKKDEGKEGKKQPKREFDRRSGTGKSGGQKKDGRGAHSFGSESQEAEQAMKDPKSAEIEAEAEVEEDTVEEGEPEAPTMTMDEYLASKKTIGTLLKNKNSNRTVDSNLVVANKPQIEALREATVVAHSSKSGFSKRHENKKSIDIKYGFAEAPRYDREDREDRGADRRGKGDNGGRGARGRGGDRDKGRGAGGRGRTVNVNNDADFPSL